MLEDAFEELGGLDGLVKWGKRNPDDFYKIWARLLPKNVEHDTGEGLEELLTRLADQRGPEPEEAEFTEVSDAEPPHLVAVGE